MDVKITAGMGKSQEMVPEKEFKRSVAKQVILGLLTNFSSIAPSMSLGFSAVALPVLTNTQNPFFLNSDQASWFASIASLATPFGCVFAGPLSDRWGRKWGLIFINVICFIGWLIIAAAFYMPQHQYSFLLIGRLFTGFSTGLSSVPATIYMAEVSAPTLRGVFCTWASISFAVGVLIVYFLGLILPDSCATIALITCVFPIVGIAFILLLIPESPNWLIRKYRLDEARRSLCKIWGVNTFDVPEIREEFSNLLKSNGLDNKALDEGFTLPEKTPKSIPQQVAKKLKYLTKMSVLKPLGLLVVFFFFQQISGTFSIVFYAINIVQEAGVELDAYLTIVLIGVVRLVSAMLASYISKIYGRRPLSLISGAGMTITMLILAAYILLNMQGKIATMSWLPLTFLLLYFFISTIGFLPIPFAMAAEVFPNRIRGTATGIASGCGYFFNFAAVKTYPTMVSSWGRSGSFFFYGAVALVGTIFVFFMLPETKGKSLQEIEEYFQKTKKRTKRISLLQEKYPDV